MKKNLAIAAAAIAGLGTVTAQTYADEMSMESDDGNRMEMEHGGRMEMDREDRMGPENGNRMGPEHARMRMGPGEARMGNGSGAHMEGGKMGAGIFKDGLSDEDKAAIKASQEKHHAGMKELSDALKAGTITKEEFAAKVKALSETHMNEILPFVAADKVEEFKERIAKMPGMHPGKMNEGKEERKREGNRERDRENRPEAGTGVLMSGPKMPKPPVATLPKALSTALDAKLATISTDAEKVTWLNAVLTKVKALEEKAKKIKNKMTLKALANLLTQKINEIESASEQDVNLNDLLQ